jgi:acetyltransferase-like isoleucine patch superfamily enzyme
MIRSLFNIIKKTRKKILKKYYSSKCERTVAACKGKPTVNFPCIFTSNVYLGTNTHFNGMSINGKGKIEIGSNFHSGKNCQIISDIHNFNGAALPYDNTFIIKDVKIGDNVWLGNNVIILGGVEIGEGCIIQAGSVVTKNIPPLSIAGGHPANVFSNRDEEHYFSLKEEKLFH